MLIGDQQFEFVLGAGLLVDAGLELLEGALDLSGLLSVFLLELSEGQFVHLALDEHEYFVDLLDEVHLLDHFALLDLLDVQFLLYFADLALLVLLDLVGFVDLLGFATLLPVQVQQVEFG